MLTAKINNGIFDDKITVDCYGKCGCKEVFNPNSGNVSCSCDDCKMDITEETEIDLSLMPTTMMQINN